MDDIMPGIAFYAFPPTYTVAGIANPYDCSILENFNSERCAKAAENIQKEAAAGNISASTECPKTWADWNKAVNPGQFDKACQDIWNKYSQDCSNAEIFQTDRCKAQRDAVAAANAKQIEARKEAEAAATKSAIDSAKEKRSVGDGSSSSSDGKSPGPCPAGQILRGGECRTNPIVGSTTSQPCPSGQTLRGGECRTNPTASNPTKRCVIKWSMSKVLGLGSGSASAGYNDLTKSECLAKLKSWANETEWNDFFTRKRSNFIAYWPEGTKIGTMPGIMK
jgi:hypothetical protein